MSIHLSKDAIDSYVDGESLGVPKESLLKHIEECESCRQEIEHRRALIELVRSSRAYVRAPAALREKVTAILNAGLADAEKTPPQHRISCPARSF